MTNPIIAIFNTISTVTDVVTIGVEGAGSYLQLWRSNQMTEHKYAHKVHALESLAEAGKRASKAKEAIAELDPEVIAYLEN